MLKEGTVSQIPSRMILEEKELPQYWYNLLADMPEKPEPYINPHTGEAADVSYFAKLFGKELAKQEFSMERYIPIPEDVLLKYRMYRPAPLHRAYTMEERLGTPARIYYKYEGGNASGSHKLNTAIPQVYYNKLQGMKALTTETGAGQWGTALSMACAFYDMPLTVFMVKASTEQKPYRKAVIETFGAEIISSPSEMTQAGRAILSQDPGCKGSIGMASSEAVELSEKGDAVRYTLGSFLNHVLLHQSVVGLETKKQLEKIGEYPDIVISCAGAGSNMGGFYAPFMQDRLKGKKHPYFIAAEAAACPTLTRGKYAYDYCDMSKRTPIAKMYTLGVGYSPSAAHVGGLRYHGMSPILSKLYHDGYIDEARSFTQAEVFEAGVLFSKYEGILPAPESCHAIKAAMDEAVICSESGESKTILFNLTGNGSYDLSAFVQFHDGDIVDYAPSDAVLAGGFASLPEITGALPGI